MLPLICGNYKTYTEHDADAQQNVFCIQGAKILGDNEHQALVFLVPALEWFVLMNLVTGFEGALKTVIYYIHKLFMKYIKDKIIHILRG